MKEKGKAVVIESQSLGSEFSSHEPLPKIDIDMKLATHILLKEVRKISCGKNVVCSPLSLEFALHTVAAGSKGETLSQILQFIGFKGNQLDSIEDLNLKSSSIVRVASSYCEKKRKREEEKLNGDEPKLYFANGVWVDKLYPLKPSYKELMTSVYDSRAESVDFNEQGDQVIRDINSWVADKTKGLVNGILQPGRPLNAALILVNTLYFKGLLTRDDKFSKRMTKDRDFHLLDGRKISVPFMSTYSPEYLFRAFDGFKVLQLNYERGNDKLRKFCMQILLPDERDGLQNLLEKCISDPGFLHQDFRLKFKKLKKLRVPKFKFTYTLHKLVGTMKNLGLTLPFEKDCEDLTEMVELPHGGSLRVSKILHKSTIEVNESGVEAAAFTLADILDGCSMVPPPPPTLTFVADHPFMFVIKEVKTGAIFFFGAVLNPLQGD